jgi:hypothetical protein
MAFKQTLLISVKNVDLKTGFYILNSIDDVFKINSILIYRSPYRGEQSRGGGCT